MRVNTNAFVLSVTFLTLPANADILAQSSLMGVMGSTDLDASTIVTLQLVEADFEVIDGEIADIPIEDPAIFVNWSFGQADLGQRLTLDPGSASWALLSDRLTNNELNYFWQYNDFDFGDPDGTLGSNVAYSETHLLNRPNDLAGTQIEHIELQLASFDVTTGADQVTTIRYTVDLTVFGAVPAPCTLAPLSALLLPGRRRSTRI